ncbi:MAG: tail fiber domain-containing protein [Waterburya sp.]
MNSKILSLNSTLNGAANITLENEKITFNGNLEFQQAQFNRIGINTNPPDDSDDIKLHIDGDLKIGNDNNFLQVTPPNNPSNNLVQFITDQDNTQGYQFDKGISLKSGDITFGKSNPNSGSIGIGINNPSARLHIKTNNNSEIVRLTDDQNQELLVIEKEDNSNYLSLKGKFNVTDELKVKDVNVTSSQTFRDNITNLSSQEVGQILQGLNPVKFTYKADQNQTLHLGFIAEEVPDVIASPDKQAINPMDIIATLTKIVKDHQETIASLSEVVEEQKEAIAILNQKVKFLEEA